ncbi:STAS domain-containing protein [Ciceribacter sp. L1K23]|uniref:STAS domain-containing protein n=1 Tax=unclassified Ciceribacter TaxID=2628820 RepID=UPI001ABEE2BB|nr:MULTISPECIES: STAS domain-containing protein [unclassified Ciceribacter]MBO3761689.1 STAS domain-containing protein [Ciceribacter sp. L1K22]MBR0558405.1 STAS domain-containing protein [Ciceribacter sp. L1K23]
MIEISDSVDDGVVVVRPRGKIDTLTAKTFEAHLKNHIDTGDGALLVDMAHVDYVSSFGLRSMLVAAKLLAPTGRKYVLFGLNPQVHEVLRVSGFLRIIPVVAAEAEALALASPPGGSS